MLNDYSQQQSDIFMLCCESLLIMKEGAGVSQPHNPDHNPFFRPVTVPNNFLKNHSIDLFILQVGLYKKQIFKDVLPEYPPNHL